MSNQVHADCYALRDRPEGRLWLCDVCALGSLPDGLVNSFSCIAKKAAACASAVMR